MINRIGVAALRFSLAATVLLALGCAAPVSLLQRSHPGPQWPESPYRARIAWVKSVATAEDAGIAKSFWKKALEIFAGRDKSSIAKPYGVLYDDARRLFIADPGAGMVHVMDTVGGRYFTISGSGDSRMRTPIALAEDDLGAVYITDSGTNAVYRYDTTSGSLTTFLRELDRPTGIVFNPVNKLLYISETNANRVVAMDRNGRQKRSIGNAGTGEVAFNRPTDLAVDRRGQIYVTDPLNYQVKIFTPEGVQVGAFGSMGDSRGEFNKPKGIAIDAEGRIFVCDTLLDAVQIFDDSGQFLFSFGATGTGDGAFWMPAGICIKGEYIFVADTFNHRVQVFRYLSGEGQEPKL